MYEFFQIHQKSSQLIKVTVLSTQNEMVNLYTTSPVRRTVYQSVPTRGTENDIHIQSGTQQETACLLRNLSPTVVLTNFNVLRQITSDIAVSGKTVDG